MKKISPRDWKAFEEISDNKKVKLSSTLAGQRELIREMWNKIKDLDKKYTFLKKRSDVWGVGFERRLMDLEQRMGEHDYFHSKHSLERLEQRVENIDISNLKPSSAIEKEQDWCECKEPTKYDCTNCCYKCGRHPKPIQPKEDIRSIIWEVIMNCTLAKQEQANKATDEIFALLKR